MALSCTWSFVLTLSLTVCLAQSNQNTLGLIIHMSRNKRKRNDKTLTLSRVRFLLWFSHQLVQELCRGDLLRSAKLMQEHVA